MKILFKYPTRGRPLKFLRALNCYYKLMTGDNFEFVISIDNDDETMNNHEVASLLLEYKNLSFTIGNSKNKIEAINADLAGKDFDILVLVSDDMIPEIRGFDDIIRSEMKKNYPDLDGVLWFFDGWRRDLNTLCILGKKYYDRFGYIYHPDYKSFWCDTEFTEVANMLERQVFLDVIIIRHLHPDVVMQDKAAFTKFNEIFPEFIEHKSFGHDATWQKNSLPGDPDKDIYKIRRSKKFDIN